jgi:hypothetical protein
MSDDLTKPDTGDSVAFLSLVLELVGAGIGAHAEARLIELLGERGHRDAVRRQRRNALIRELGRECAADGSSIRRRARLAHVQLATAANVPAIADVPGDRGRQLARRVLTFGAPPRYSMLRTIIAGSDLDLEGPGQGPPIAIGHE